MAVSPWTVTNVAFRLQPIVKVMTVTRAAGEIPRIRALSDLRVEVLFSHGRRRYFVAAVQCLRAI
jgi:hypothetical protein